MAKLLLSPLLLENSNARQEDRDKNKSNLPTTPKPINWTEEASYVAWETPKKSSDLKRSLLVMTDLGDTGSATRRQLIRKFQKGWDVKDYDLATAKLRIKVLEAQVERL